MYSDAVKPSHNPHNRMRISVFAAGDSSKAPVSSCQSMDDAFRRRGRAAAARSRAVLKFKPRRLEERGGRREFLFIPVLENIKRRREYNRVYSLGSEQLEPISNFQLPKRSRRTDLSWRRPRIALLSWNSLNVISFKRHDGDLDRVGFCSRFSSLEKLQKTAPILQPKLLKGRRERMMFMTNALPADTYWITVFQAVGVSVLMALAAVISGVVINIGLEIKAIKEFVELEKKGEFREEDYELVPDDDFGGFESEEALYIFTNKDLSGNRPARNRPVRELQEAELHEVNSEK
ncbi:hypothetical protein R1flu_025961 [Riccia fluitans]|uniref:Uncharacterized protein n=1 Tax=Riccia fluitans TaxID=41844 RepID=A0ABD1XH97_9MARC